MTTGRVTIDRVLNPEVWENRETYLKIEGVILDDSGKKDETPPEDVYGAIATAASVILKLQKGRCTPRSDTIFPVLFHLACTKTTCIILFSHILVFQLHSSHQQSHHDATPLNVSLHLSTLMQTP